MVIEKEEKSTENEDWAENSDSGEEDSAEEMNMAGNFFVLFFLHYY